MNEDDGSAEMRRKAMEGIVSDTTGGSGRGFHLSLTKESYLPG